MPLYSNPPHRADVYSAMSVTRDGGGGTVIMYSSSPVQSSLPCSINTADSRTVEQFAQQGMVVTHTVGVLSSALTLPIERGWKVVNTRTSKAFHVQGISDGEAYGTIPRLTYLHCVETL